MDKLKKAKEFLKNFMIIVKCRENIIKVMKNYPDDIDDEEISKEDLQNIVQNLETIISCNQKNNTSTKEEIEIMNHLQKILKNK